MKQALELKGDMPNFSDIEIFTISSSVAAKLKFKTANDYCLMTDQNFNTSNKYYRAIMNESMETLGILKTGRSIKCISK